MISREDTNIEAQSQNPPLTRFFFLHIVYTPRQQYVDQCEDEKMDVQILRNIRSIQFFADELLSYCCEILRNMAHKNRLLTISILIISRFV